MDRRDGGALTHSVVRRVAIGNANGSLSSTRWNVACVQQATWWMEQLAYLLSQLAARPEDGGTMLDHSLVPSCTDMPFILAGGGSGRIRTGRLLQLGYRRHADLLLSIANAMGDGLTAFGLLA